MDEAKMPIAPKNQFHLTYAAGEERNIFLTMRTAPEMIKKIYSVPLFPVRGIYVPDK